jgi:hypothetical protein
LVRITKESAVAVIFLGLGVIAAILAQFTLLLTRKTDLCAMWLIFGSFLTAIAMRTEIALSGDRVAISAGLIITLALLYPGLFLLRVPYETYRSFESAT